MSDSSPPTHPQSSNVLTYVVLAVVAFGIVAFLFLLFGPFVIFLIGAFGFIGVVGALHYFLWGRAQSQDAGTDTDASTD